MTSVFVGMLAWTAQAHGATKRASVALELGVYDEATAVPGRRVVGLPVHPGLEAAAVIPLRREGRKTRLDVVAGLGGFHHAHLVNGFTVDAALRVEHGMDVGLVVGAGLGTGLLGSLTTTREFVLDGGEYRESSSRIRLGLRVHAAPHLGWRLGSSAARSPTVSLRYRVWVETPFAPDFIPLMVHGDLGLVLRMPLSGSRS